MHHYYNILFVTQLRLNKTVKYIFYRGAVYFFMDNNITDLYIFHGFITYNNSVGQG